MPTRSGGKFFITVDLTIGPSKSSQRESFVRKQGAITCRAMKYRARQPTGSQNGYDCDLGRVSMSHGTVTFTGEAAELAYKSLSAKYLRAKSYDDLSTVDQSIEAPVLGKLKAVVDGYVCMADPCVPTTIYAIKTDDAIYETVWKCSHPFQALRVYGGGEFFKAVEDGVLPPTRINEYTCTLNL